MNQTVSENPNLLNDLLGNSQDLSDTNAAIASYAVFLRQRMPNFETRLLAWLKATLIKGGRSSGWINRMVAIDSTEERQCRLLRQFLSTADLLKLEIKLREQVDEFTPASSRVVHLD